MEVPSGRLPKIEELWISREPLALRAPTEVLIRAAMITYTILVAPYYFFIVSIYIYIYIIKKYIYIYTPKPYCIGDKRPKVQNDKSERQVQQQLIGLCFF